MGALVSTFAGCGAPDDARTCAEPYVTSTLPVDDAGIKDDQSLARQRCDFKADQTVAETVDKPPDLSKVKHVIVIMRENRSFDHYLGAYEHREQSDPLGDPTNPDPSTHKLVRRFHEQHYCTRSPKHEWNSVHLQYNNGRLDGFVAATNVSENNDQGCVAMGFYDRGDLPFYYWLADHYAISEAYHSSLLGPTMPNIMFYYYASSCNATENIEASGSHWVDDACGDRPTIFKRVKAAGHTIQVYSDAQIKLPIVGTPVATPQASAAVVLAGYSPLEARSIAQFQQDVAAGTLADVVFIEPNYHNPSYGIENDEHPPSNIQDGQAFVHDRITEIMKVEALWTGSVIFVTWDEHGGYYDHVIPPKACPPDDSPAPSSFDFHHLGFRTPFFLVSPFARENYASSITADHTSIPRFIEAWLGLGAMSARDANAWPLFDMFDFRLQRAAELPPLMLKDKNLDARHVATCDSGKESSSCVVQ